MRYSLEIDGRVFEVAVTKHPDFTVSIDGDSLSPTVRKTKQGIQVWIGGHRFSVAREGAHLTVNGKLKNVSVRDIDFVPEAAAIVEESEEIPREEELEDRTGAIHPPMPGRVVSVSAKKDQKVSLGGPLLILEAMKMQNEISSPMHGVVREVKVKPGDLVDVSDVLIVIEPA